MSRVLVVDDEPSQRFLMRRIFEHVGHVVDEAVHGVDAIESAKAVRPDLLITDIMMPMMDGIELIRRFRTDPATTDIPILAVSGHARVVEHADLVLTKPYGMSELLHAAASLLRGPHSDACPT